MKKKTILINSLLISSFLLMGTLNNNLNTSTSQSVSEKIQPGKLAIVIVMDGVGRDFFTAENFPNVFQKLVPKGVLFTQGMGVSPAITTVNHVSLITGSYPNVTGAVATSTFNSTAYHLDGSLNRVSFGSSDSIPTETLITNADDVLNLLVVGKSKLANMKKDLNISKGSTYTVLSNEFKDISILDEDNNEISVDVYNDKFSTEVRFQQNSWLINESMSQLLVNKDKILNGRDTFLFINLPATDWAAHTFGVKPSPFHLNTSIYKDLVIDIDVQINRLLNFLETNGLFDTSSFFLTSDHGSHNVLPGSPRPILGSSGATAFDVAMNTSFYSIENKSYQNLYVVATAENTLHLYLRWPELTVKKALEYLHTESIADDFIGDPTIWSRLWLRDAYKDIVNDSSLYTGLLTDVGMNTELAGDIVIEYRVDASPFGGFKPEFASSLGDHGVAEDLPIPMLMAGAGFKNNLTEDRVARITDIIPTVARYLGIDKPAQSNGKVWEEYFINEGAVTEVNLDSINYPEDTPIDIQIEYKTFRSGSYRVNYFILDKEFSIIFEGNKPNLSGSGNVTFSFSEGGKFQNSPYYIVGQIQNSSGYVIDQAQDFIVITTAVAPEFPYIWVATLGVMVGVIVLTVSIGNKVKRKNI